MRLVKDLAVVGVSALLAALVAGPFVVPGTASAGPEDALGLGTLLEPGPFDATGVGLTMDLDPETCAPGEKLAATLRAVNRNEGEEERRIRIVMHDERRPGRSRRPVHRLPPRLSPRRAAEPSRHGDLGEPRLHRPPRGLHGDLSSLREHPLPRERPSPDLEPRRILLKRPQRREREAHVARAVPAREVLPRPPRELRGAARVARARLQERCRDLDEPLEEVALHGVA